MAWACTLHHSPSPSFLAPSPISLQQCTSSSSLRLQSQRLLNKNLSGCRPRSQKKDSKLRLSCLHDPKASVVTGNSWDKLVLNSDTPVLVEFYASWCGPCRMVHRVIDELATDYSGKLKCFVLNADTDADIAADYEIKAVPVVLLFKNGKKLEHVIGTMPKEFYIAAIERVISS